VPRRLRVVPSPATGRQIPSWRWHRAGVDPRRSRVVLEVCRRATAIERLAALDGAAAREALTSLPGVGVWTAAETVQRSHGDSDAVSVGDYHLAGFIGTALAGRPVDDDGMMRLLSPWTGRRQRVVRLLLAAGIPMRRRGPRATIQDHRWH
jgi:3-methyladenine DNA glycosylase/8-oxoguanine DNA glycosylase